MIQATENIEQVFTDFVKDFVSIDKQERILLFYNNRKNWWKIKNEFHTSNPFNSRRLLEIEPSRQNTDEIYSELKKLGCQDRCLSLLDYLSNESYECNLAEKLAETVAFLAETIIFCPKTKIGYYEGGHAKDRFILM